MYTFNWLSCLDCRENGKMQEFYHPGLFSGGKWTCCDHRSKHSCGCQPSFLRNDMSLSSSHPVSPTRVVSPSRMGGQAHRGPLPPTPSAASYSDSPHYNDRALVTGEQIKKGRHNVSSYHTTELQGNSRGGHTNSAPPLPVPVSGHVCGCVYMYVRV